MPPSIAPRAAGAACPLRKLPVDHQQVVVQSFIGKQLITHGPTPNTNRAIVDDGTAMAKNGRNQPCPCGSGKKYKHCCWSRDRAAWVATTPAVSPHGYHFAETELDRLSNRVVDLLDEGRLDEADAACEKLRTRYPDVHDWLMRKAMIYEARGELELAIEYCERTIAWMDAHPEDFEPASREPFRDDIERLQRLLRDST